LKREIIVYPILLLLLFNLFLTTFRMIPLARSDPDEFGKEIWKAIEVHNPQVTSTVADIDIDVSSKDGVNVALSTSITEYFENETGWQSMGYDNYMEWLDGTETLPYHWGHIDWYVSEGSLTSITYNEIQQWGEMYLDSGGGVEYVTFMGNTYMADWNLSANYNDPDIISPSLAWAGNKITLENLNVPSASSVWIVLKIVMTNPGIYLFNLTSPQGIVQISPSSWEVGGAANLLVPDEYSTIQAAIDAAIAGDAIIVRDGTYVEDLSIPATKTNLEIKPDAGASVTIKGVQNVPEGDWPLAKPNIEIDANGVKIHGFIIEGPDYASGYYSSGIVIGASNVEIYNNTFRVTSAETLGEISQAIQTYHKDAISGVDISGLNIHNNIFTQLSAGAAGYEGIYINLDEGTNTAAVQYNHFSGSIVRAITTERSKTTIKGNTIMTDLAPGLPGGYQGINVGGANNGNVASVSVEGNTINGSASGKGFKYGVKLGYLDTSTFTDIVITGNTIHMSEVGVFVKFSADGIKVNRNNIYGNTNYSVSNADSATLDAEYNWWGDEEGPRVRAMLTTDSHYDRNPSFFIANDGKWWLFFVRASDSLPHVPPTYNPDAATYDVWYMTSTDEGFTWSSETKITPTTSQRGMAAFQDDTGKVWVFVSSPGAGTIQYYTSTDDGDTWSGPTATGYLGSHVDAFQASDGRIWVFYEGGTGIEAIKSLDYGGSWTQVTGIGPSPNDGIPKTIEAYGKLYVVWCNWAVGGKAWYTTSTDGLIGNSWNSATQLVDVPDTIMCDPILYEDSYGVFWLFYAPWDTVTDSQWIEYIKSTDSGGTWSAPTSVTPGGYGATYWWDMWPKVAQDPLTKKIVLFYGSESSADGTTRIDGNIWMTVWTPPESTGDYVSQNADFTPWLIQPYPPEVPIGLLHVEPSVVEFWTPAHGSNFDVQVKISNVSLLYGFQFNLTWDSALLTLESATYYAPWTQYHEVKETQAPSYYLLALSATSPASPFTGTKTLATLTFNVIHDPIYPNSATCDLRLENVTMGDPDGQDIPRLIYSGEYSIYSTRPKVILSPHEYIAHKVPTEFELNINVTDVVNLHECKVELTYNKTLLNIIDVEIHPFFTGDYLTEWEVSNTIGKLLINITDIVPYTNGSGPIATVTFRVIYSFVWNINKPSINCTLKFNSSTLLTEGDVAIEHDAINGIYYYAPLKGDLNKDGTVGLIDLVIAGQAFGSKPTPPYDIADLNRDGIIDILDIIIIARNYGRTG